MSTPFNYELDERQIRQLLLNTTFESTEADWQAFDGTKVELEKTQASTSVLKGSSLALSRNIIMPILFMAGIGIFTILLMNMISLKPKANKTPIERELKPSAIETKSVPQTVSQNPSGALLTTSLTPKKDSSLAPSTSIPTQAITSPPLTNLPPNSASEKAKLVAPITSPNPQPLRNAPLLATDTNAKLNPDSSWAIPKKKRKKKREAEVLESIQAPSLLSDNDKEIELK